MSKRKKVHFADSLSTKENDCKVDAPNKKRRSKPLNFNDRKTSEYKYFRELQEKINHDPHSSQLTKEDNYTKILKPNEEKKELCKSTILDSDISLSLPISITPVSGKFLIDSKAAQDELVYPIHSGYNKNKDLSTTSIIPIAQRSHLQTSQDSWNAAFKCESNGLFSEKRCKLLALLSKSYSLETDKLTLNRSDIISKVVKRLRIVKESNRELEDLPERDTRVSDGIYHLTNLPQDVSIMQCNNSKYANFAASATRAELCKYPFSNDFNEADEHERFELACSEVQAFPDALEDDLLDNNPCNWKLVGKDSPEKCASWITTSLAKWIPDDTEDGKDSPEQCASWISTSLAKWITEETEDGTNKVHRTSCEELIPNYYSSCHSTDRSLIPYSKAKCLDLSHLRKLEEGSMFSLPLLNANNVEEPSLCSASNSLVCYGIDHVLPTSHAALNVGGSNSELGWRNIFSSQLSKNCEMMLQDTYHQSLDISSPKLSRSFELQYKCLPINLDWGCLSATCFDRKLLKDETENSEVFSDNASKCDSRIGDVTHAAYFSSSLFGSWDFDLDG